MIKLVRFFLCLCLFASGLALADSAPPSMYTYSGSSTKYSSKDAACSAWFSTLNSDDQAYYGGGVKLVTGSSCVTNQNSGSVFITTVVGNCPAGTTLGTDGICHPLPPPPDTCSVGADFRAGISTYRGVVPSCYMHCAIVVKDVLSCANTPTVTYCNYMVSRLGGACSDDSTSESDVGASDADPRVNMPPLDTGTAGGKCPTGSVQGGVDSDGTTICIGTGSAPPAPAVAPPTVKSPPTTVTNADGSTTTTQTTTTTNSDGSATTVTNVTVTGSDGTSSTSQSSHTGNTPAGTAGTPTPSPDDAKYDLCKQNPMLSVCRNSSVSGSCEAIACDGDAIQCATLRAAAQIQCKQKQDSDELSASGSHSLGAAVVGGSDPLASTLPTVGNAAQVAMPSSLDSSGWLGGGAVFLDKSFTIQGHTITIPFSSALNYLLVLRYALMVVALLISFRILSGAIIRE
jgi:hypothetical protein